MTIRRHWAAIIALAGIVSGCGDPPGKTITPPNLGFPDQARAWRRALVKLDPGSRRQSSEAPS